MRRFFPALALVLATCHSGAGSRCERICHREAQCANELDLDYDVDVGECTVECGKLEREPDLVRFVDDHVKCVDEAVSCRAVVECP